MNDKKLLCASMMCADFGNLKNEITLLEDSGIDIFHLDIMDGIFVPNFGIGLQDVEYICQNAKILCDVHLMISHPIQYVEKFAKLGAQIIYIHPETDPHACRTLQKIKIVVLLQVSLSILEHLLKQFKIYFIYVIMFYL